MELELEIYQNCLLIQIENRYIKDVILESIIKEDLDKIGENKV